jgi:hypothetical protein
VEPASGERLTHPREVAPTSRSYRRADTVAGAPGLRAALLAGALPGGMAARRPVRRRGDNAREALDLIVEDRGSRPLACVQQRRARLLRPCHVPRLADAMEAPHREARCRDD